MLEMLNDRDAHGDLVEKHICADSNPLRMQLWALAIIALVYLKREITPAAIVDLVDRAELCAQA
jgi:hypothetical protein